MSTENFADFYKSIRFIARYSLDQYP